MSTGTQPGTQAWRGVGASLEQLRQRRRRSCQAGAPSSLDFFFPLAYESVPG